jgi:small subunit ribosomal protein S15
MLLFSIMLTARQKTRIIKETAVHAKDTGSSEVQIALLSKKIAELTDHLRKHRKDNHSRRGLLGMVADRQTHLNYLKKNYPRRYSAIIKKLDLKK